MINLAVYDNNNVLSSLDSQGMLSIVEELPQQCRDAYKLDTSNLVPTYVKNIVISAMGASAIAGDLLRSYVQDEMHIPTSIFRTYALPAYVDKDSLVIVLSYSGNTEEVLSSYYKAREIGAKVIVITAGGMLCELAKNDNVPFFLFPLGYPARTTVGMCFIYLLKIYESLGFIKNKLLAVDNMLILLENLQKKWWMASSQSENLAKSIARNIQSRIPIIYGSSGIMGTLAKRWKCQINENANMVAFCNDFPELNHNEMMGWCGNSPHYRQFFFIILRDKDEDPVMHLHIDFTKSLLIKKSTVEELWSIGDTILEKIFSFLYLGDLMSVYLALLTGVDPTPIEAIDQLSFILGKER